MDGAFESANHYARLFVGPSQIEFELSRFLIDMSHLLQGIICGNKEKRARNQSKPCFFFDIFHLLVKLENGHENMKTITVFAGFRHRNDFAKSIYSDFQMIDDFNAVTWQSLEAFIPRLKINNFICPARGLGNVGNSLGG